MIQFFEAYKPILITKRVNWQPPHAGWYKCNTNGASKGNPGPSSIGFCVRDEAGDLVYAKSVDIGVITNVVTEAQAILQGLEYCVTHEKHPLILETDSFTLKKVIERIQINSSLSLNCPVQGGEY
nr:14.7 kDa ribonuclease H-like protein [Nicotiana tomentosiformis]